VGLSALVTNVIVFFACALSFAYHLTLRTFWLLPPANCLLKKGALNCWKIVVKCLRQWAKGYKHNDELIA
jgi:hypothetical protein